jgi:alpha-galactosidase
VLDDGWFGERSNDRKGLGDWWVNEKKLKGSLKTLIDYVHESGMKFGLWFEPEMVNEDSDVFRAHPDWAIKIPYRNAAPSRDQLVFDLTKQEVRDYVVDSVNAILGAYEIDYVKWDMNRNITEIFSDGLPCDRQKEIMHRYILGVYEICERIINGNPDIFFEGCSSGGGRFDPAMGYYFPQIWTSDDTDANERTKIQYGTGLCYPLSLMSCHVSICPNHATGRNTSFMTRADIAHLGATGYELDTTQITEEDLSLVKGQVEDYKRMQNLVLHGDLYRLDNPYESNFFTEELTAKDKSESVITCYRRLYTPNYSVKRVYPKGLDPHAEYFVEEMNAVLLGSTIMNAGLVPSYPRGDFTTTVFHLKKVVR